MNTAPRKIALAVGLGLTLAACGGHDDAGSDAASPAGKALPANGTAAQTDGNTSSRTPKAVPAGIDALRAGADGKTEIRGDLLIQLLLSRMPERDAQNQPKLTLLDAETADSHMVGETEYVNDRLLGPALLIDEDVTTNADATLPGTYSYHLATSAGPTHGSLNTSVKSHTTVGSTTEPDIRIGLSQPGLAKGRVSPPITTPLEISKRLIVAPSRNGSDRAPQSAQQRELTGVTRRAPVPSTAPA